MKRGRFLVWRISSNRICIFAVLVTGRITAWTETGPSRWIERLLAHERAQLVAGLGRRVGSGCSRAEDQGARGGGADPK